MKMTHAYRALAVATTILLCACSSGSGGSDLSDVTASTSTATESTAAPEPVAAAATPVAAPVASTPAATPATPATTGACVATTLGTLSNCVNASRANTLSRDQAGTAHITLANDISCGSNCCPGGDALLDLSGASNLQIDGQGFRLLRKAGQRNCSLLTARDASNITLSNVVLDDDETVPACVVNDRCPRMVYTENASNITLSDVTVRHAKGYAIYVRSTNGFNFQNSKLEHSGVLGLYIGHEEHSSRNINITGSQFTDNSTNALALLGAEGPVVIEGNLFARNHAIGQWPVAARFGTGMTGGGQVYIARASDVLIENNRIVDGYCSNCYFHGQLGTGVTGIELGKPGDQSVNNIRIIGNVIENNDAYAVAANVTSPINASVQVTDNQLRGNGANWRLDGAVVAGNQIVE